MFSKEHVYSAPRSFLQRGMLANQYRCLMIVADGFGDHHDLDGMGIMMTIMMIAQMMLIRLLEKGMVRMTMTLSA